MEAGCVLLRRHVGNMALRAVASQSSLWCSQFLHETGPGLVPASLNKRFLVESDRGMRLFCPSPNLCLQLGIFVDLINNYAEFFIRDLTICECPQDMGGYGVEFTLGKNQNLVMLFCLHREPAADKFTGDTSSPSTTGAAMIVDRRPTPPMPIPSLAESSAVSTASTALIPRRYFLKSWECLSFSSSSCFLSREISWSRKY